MRSLNEVALRGLVELIYLRIGVVAEGEYGVFKFLPYDNIQFFFREIHLPAARADADRLGLPCWEGLPSDLLSQKPDEKQTKEWLCDYLRDLNSRQAPGQFLPATLETVVLGVLTKVSNSPKSRHLDQVAVELDRVLDRAGLGLDFTDGTYLLVARSQLPREREIEQKFKILNSAGQARCDFDAWAAVQLEPALIFVDIDRFKGFNDRFTEARVDRTLLPSFQTLLKGIVDGVGFAYRYGGEEFVVLLPHGKREWATECANSVLHRVNQHRFEINSHVVSVTVSIGVAFYGQHGVVYDDVLLAANEAKNLAKRGGRNRVEIAR